MLPGLLDIHVEFLVKDGKYYVVYDGKIELYENCQYGQTLIKLDMMRNADKVHALSKLGYHGEELELKWIECRFGSFDNIPDYDADKDEFNPEYHFCAERVKCPLSGIVCKLPQGQFGKITHKEIEVIESIANGEADKQGAKNLHVTFNTFRSYVQSIYKKTGVNNKAGLVQFAFKNNICQG